MLIILFVLHCQRTFLAFLCLFCVIYSSWTRLAFISLAPCNFCYTLQLYSVTVVSLSFHQLRCKKGNLGRWEDMEWEVRMRKSSKSFPWFLPCHAALYKNSLPGHGRPGYFLPSILWIPFNKTIKLLLNFKCTHKFYYLQ